MKHPGSTTLALTLISFAGCTGSVGTGTVYLVICTYLINRIVIMTWAKQNKPVAPAFFQRINSQMQIFYPDTNQIKPTAS
jgi:hypothetical protein